ncbi:MAG: TolC family protein [Microcystis aeruginosa LG13-03]|nr:TolC family protein [Microcystis aeruginosa LG13-13]NCR02480.1 TolC family protein [Microcystis aeruginosa LG13-03]NCR60679.1 TolC family protein [Microcystis aeruginosa LG11-05]
MNAFPLFSLLTTLSLVGGIIGMLSAGGLAQSLSPVSPTVLPSPEPVLGDSDLLQLPVAPLVLPQAPSELQIQTLIKLSLLEALDLARKNNRQLQITQQQLQQAQLKVKSAEAAYLPNLSLGINLNTAVYSVDSLEQKFYNQVYSSVGLNYNQTQTVLIRGPSGVNQYTITPLDNPFTTLDTTLTLSYLVYGGGGRAGHLQAAQEQLKIQLLQVELQQQTLNQQIRLGYYSIQQAQAQIQIAEDNLNNAQITLNDAQALKEAGFATIADVLQAQVQVKNAQQQLAQSQGDLLSAQSNLTQLLSVRDGVMVTAADEIRLEDQWALSLPESLGVAYSQRPELKQQLLQQKVAQAQQQIALANIRPQVQLVAQTDINKALNSGGGFPDGVDGNFWGGGYSLTAQMQWNFYDGGNASAQAQSAKVSEEIAVTQFADVHNQIRQEVTQSYANLQVSQANYSTAQEAVKFAEQSLGANRTRFLAGVGTQLDVISAQNNLNQAKLSLLRATVSYNQAIANLRRAVGQNETTTTNIP